MPIRHPHLTIGRDGRTRASFRSYTERPDRSNATEVLIGRLIGQFSPVLVTVRYGVAAAIGWQ